MDSHQPASDAIQLSPGIRRARRTAACARTAIAAGALLAVLSEPSAAGVRGAAGWTLAGFSIILVTGAVQLLVPGRGLLAIEESLAPISALLIVGAGPPRVTAVSLLWLSAVACGVLARGGRQHWLGRALLLLSLALPLILHPGLHQPFFDLCLGTIALLLTCGRVTRELRSIAEQARWEADHDGLTGALSRPAFRGELSRIAKAAGSGSELSLFVIDLDNFRAINKARGHAAGDAVLRAVVERLRCAAADAGPVGRLGGDEFAAVVAGADPAAAARDLIEGLEATVRLSVGIARIGRDGRDAETLLRAGDVALRVAKRGGGRGEIYAGESLSDTGPAGARSTLERLIGGEGLAIFVQPIVDLGCGEAHAYEALARFQTGSTSSPLHWFALADELGARDRLELACLQAALEHFGRRPPGTSLSVNISSPLLADPRTQGLLAGHADLHGLIVELTENSVVEDPAALREQIDALTARGARIALDDLGAGYSGLTQMMTVRPHYLKLDRGLISGIDRDPDRAALVTAMLSYARHTGGRLVAEGVETEAELETLRALGVTLIQGFYLGRPAPPWPAPSAAARAAGAAGTGAERPPVVPVA
ncbi:MAG TPA: bifunctional diguanylate cyclase/phosphodiesterase [Solirubrobacteraceae bacterium]|nr:bifunctional diguanylate cyclase/phosphodiesterase [Solirubrobacteraceae bacterium]